MKQYLDILDKILVTKVKPQLDHLEAMGTLFLTSVEDITLTERGLILSSMSMGARRLKKSIDKAEREQKDTLLLKADFDARQVKGVLDALICKMTPYMSPPSEEDGDSDIEELLERDDYEGILSADEKGNAHKQMRVYLLRNYYNIFSKIKDSVERAGNTLSRLMDLQSSIENDSDKREELWEKMHKTYLDEEWPSQKESLVYNIRSEIDSDDNRDRTKIQILDKELKLLEMDNIANVHKRELKELNMSVVNHKKLAIPLFMLYRHEFNDEDISEHFCFYYSHKLITEAKETLILLNPAEHDILFVNKAAQEYVELLIPVLKLYGGIVDKGHYGVLKMVLQELCLVYTDKSNGLQMMTFVNERMIEEEDAKFPSQDSITFMTSKLNGKCFARLAQEGLSKTKLNKRDYERLKDVYWRCFTILNYYNIIDLGELRYDDYLAHPHPQIMSIELWSEMETETKNRLSFLAFVLTGKTIKF